MAPPWVPAPPPLPAMGRLPPPATPPDLYAVGREPPRQRAGQAAGRGAGESFSLPGLAAPPIFRQMMLYEFITLPPYSDVRGVADLAGHAAAPPPPPETPAFARRRHLQQQQADRDKGAAAVPGPRPGPRQAGNFYRRGSLEPLQHPVEALQPQEDWARLGLRTEEDYAWRSLLVRCQVEVRAVVLGLLPHVERREHRGREMYRAAESRHRGRVFAALPQLNTVAREAGGRGDVAREENLYRYAGPESLLVGGLQLLVWASEPSARGRLGEVAHAVQLGLLLREGSARSDLFVRDQEYVLRRQTEQQWAAQRSALLDAWVAEWWAAEVDRGESAEAAARAGLLDEEAEGAAELQQRGEWLRETHRAHTEGVRMLRYEEDAWRDAVAAEEQDAAAALGEAERAEREAQLEREELERAFRQWKEQTDREFAALRCDLCATEEAARAEHTAGEAAVVAEGMVLEKDSRERAEHSDAERAARPRLLRAAEEGWAELVGAQEQEQRPRIAEQEEVRRALVAPHMKGTLRLIAAHCLQRFARWCGAVNEMARRRRRHCEYLRRVEHVERTHQAADETEAAVRRGRPDDLRPAEQGRRKALATEEDLGRWLRRGELERILRWLQMNRSRPARWARSLAYEEHHRRKRLTARQPPERALLECQWREGQQRLELADRTLPALRLVAQHAQVEWISLRALWEAWGREHEVFSVSPFRSASCEDDERQGRSGIERQERDRRSKLRVFLRGAASAATLAAELREWEASAEEGETLFGGPAPPNPLPSADSTFSPAAAAAEPEAEWWENPHYQAAARLQRVVKLEGRVEPHERETVAAQERLERVVVMEQPLEWLAVLHAELDDAITILAATAERYFEACFLAELRWTRGAVLFRDSGALQMRERRLRPLVAREVQPSFRRLMLELARCTHAATFAEQAAALSPIEARHRLLPSIITAIRDRDLATPGITRLQAVWRARPARKAYPGLRAARRQRWAEDEERQLERHTAMRVLQWFRQRLAYRDFLEELDAGEC
eukprot:TRINITY_DN70174_c0_g1_i1.p1 TRINITY_DN70174_c0_g1~~TRINITY_DN70174_c0_g1_i1.p1  ORF type:complete len:1021 (+),score=351.42 TRINITY_DN70174_c0_g1_i1:67-3129(+)